MYSIIEEVMTFISCATVIVIVINLHLQLSRPTSHSGELQCGTYLVSGMEHEMEFMM